MTRITCKTPLQLIVQSTENKIYVDGLNVQSEIHFIIIYFSH